MTRPVVRLLVSGMLFALGCGAENAGPSRMQVAPGTHPAGNAVAIETVAQTALVIVDLQTRIVAQRTAPRTGAEVVRRAARLADAFRRHGGLVVIVRVERPGVPTQPPGSELVAEMTPHPEDLLITKHTWGAFHETGLAERLRARGITTLALAGIATNFGVESTAREADEDGYKLLLVEDAMAGMTERAHAFAVEEIFPHLGTVCTAKDVLHALGEHDDRPDAP
jgi:nicotinamidase-related amidase